MQPRFFFVFSRERRRIEDPFIRTSRRDRFGVHVSDTWNFDSRFGHREHHPVTHVKGPPPPSPLPSPYPFCLELQACHTYIYIYIENVCTRVTRADRNIVGE